MPQVPHGCPLTRRQFEVVQLLGEGLTAQQIGHELGIAYSTVRSLNNAAFRALGCANATQAVAEMGRRGWMGWKAPEAAPETVSPLAVEAPFLAAFLQEFEASRWPHEPDDRSARGMALALAGHRNTLTTSS